MQNVVEFFDEDAVIGGLHERDGGLQKRAALRKPDLAVRPQAEVIELGDAVERIVATGMRVARPA